jgi:hypothetical protein
VPVNDVKRTLPFGSVSIPSAPVKPGVGRTTTAGLL